MYVVFKYGELDEGRGFHSEADLKDWIQDELNNGEDIDTWERAEIYQAKEIGKVSIGFRVEVNKK